MPIGLYELFDLVQVKAKRVQLLDYFFVNRYWMLSHYNSSIVFYVGNAIPRVLPYFVNFVSVRGVCVKYFLNEVFTVRTHKLGDLIVGIQDFLVKEIGVGVFERQVATHHRIKNNPATPYVAHQAVVFFACDHFRSCIAWTSTGCF